MKNFAQGGCSSADARWGIRCGEAEYSFDSGVIEMSIQTIGVKSDQFGKPILSLAELFDHGSVLVLFQSLAQIS
ncbi:hypothetical protein ADL05_27620 [Nocardiopsis sp. NRRL B-16309]|nr:hypothetical protein ADL05_27620 [Nocardiopsis sp. NRRL B-16309]